jgi:hypothetical protein
VDELIVMLRSKERIERRAAAQVLSRIREPDPLCAEILNEGIDTDSGLAMVPSRPSEDAAVFAMVYFDLPLPAACAWARLREHGIPSDLAGPLSHALECNPQSGQLPCVAPLRTWLTSRSGEVDLDLGEFRRPLKDDPQCCGLCTHHTSWKHCDALLRLVAKLFADVAPERVRVREF